MAFGSPDWFGRIGASSLPIQSSEYNITISNYTAGFNLVALTTGTVDLPDVPSGFKHLMIGCEISCQNNDTAMLLELVQKDISYAFNNVWFVTNKFLDLKQYSIPAGDNLRFIISNFHATTTINFRITLFWILVKA